MRNRVGLDSMRRLALVVVRREVRFDLREVIEMARAGALELAPQFMVADGGAARLEEILGFRKFRHPGCRASVVRFGATLVYQSDLTNQAHHRFTRGLGRRMLGRLRKKTLVVL